ncbi:hypothetical protein DICPUDRAFT_74327 [Dictyostelium purpureum]|uniref:Sulfhydryl oxidase n=1 Tax=Dictyostelium purpureum TaxID=5786 RepID=F0Z7E8_DICPU|nr:uncharacterized protein DICPUDRAFT_74327 [Dictyostelium purpureum]EGC40129.1 hypothetical protein DICPUDRAFT_74327 [Dictyostelium purpureum]|eukprot:XP_003283319.1 hypothetical protein DICPUDRAFT_74327 [Dictyostelium purpureum]
MVKYYCYFLIILLIINIVNSFHTDKTYDKKFEIQRASFFFLTANAYRYSLENEQWCEESKVAGGRPYVWSDYRNTAISYLDLYIALQFDSSCEDKLVQLRKWYADNVEQPTSFAKNSEMWESDYLPMVTDAFTCGFNGSKLVDYDIVSHDLRENFDNEPLKQKIWHMIGPYMTSIYKQRENANRRLDLDAGLYIPFLDKYTGFHYTKEQQMRIGFPTYMGRALWYIFHTLAQRIADNECSVDINDKLFEIAKNFVVYFTKGSHPCPICKEHFISRILVNDRFAPDSIDNEAMRYYPIEHLLLGGIAGDAHAKISTIKASDKNSLAAFFWIVHNAVTASVDNGCSCFTEENEDDKPYNCVMDYRFQVQQQFPRQQRSYPFMKRFEFILTPDHNYTLFDDARDQFRSILGQINSLDTFALRNELISYWQTGKNISADGQSKVTQLLELINNMTNQFIASKVLEKVYTYSDTVPLNCDIILEKLDSSPQVDTPTIVFDKTPAVCKPYLQPSLCDQQYLYRYFTKPPTNPTSSSVLTTTSGSTAPTSSSTTSSVTSPPSQTKNVEQTSSNSSQSIFNLPILNIYLFITIFIIFMFM